MQKVVVEHLDDLSTGSLHVRDIDTLFGPGGKGNHTLEERVIDSLEQLMKGVSRGQGH